jgi:purine-binding chemotaxis protein CheW
MITSPSQLLTCRCGDYTLGFDVRVVQEVLTEQAMTRVPRAPRTVCGLLNLRGEVVPAVYLNRRLEISDTVAIDRAHRHIIININDCTISLIVDEVGEVHPLDPTHYFSDIGSLDAPFSKVVLGIYNTPNLTVLHLDPEASCRVLNGGSDE